MMLPISPIPRHDSAERSRLLAVDLLRRRALERLYARRDAVENLIRSLEDYNRCLDDGATECFEFNSALKCS